MTSLLIVDCQYDFISGALACEGAEDAVRNIVAHIDACPDTMPHWSADWHGPSHCSFVPNGGRWPIHCVAGTRGAEIHAAFFRDVADPARRPSEATVYHKGTDDGREEYSAFEARNALGRTVAEDLDGDVTICGIATEFCVRETVLAFLAAGRRTTVLADALAWVDRAGHERTLDELAARGVIVRGASRP